MEPCRCSTCHLNTYHCPGHSGHIDLPVPVYHPLFFPQLLQILRSKCAYCNHLRLHPAEVNRYTCQLRLLEYGLLESSRQLEEIISKYLSLGVDGDESDTGEDGEEDVDEGRLANVIRKRIDFVKTAISQHGGKKYLKTLDRGKTEAIAEARRAIIRDFLAACTKAKKCGSCQG